MKRYKNLAQWFENTDLRFPKSGEIKIDEWYKGKYQINALLGYGHTSMVFRAIDTQLERLVALKVWIDTWHFDSSILLKEGKLLANAHHSNIVKVYDFGIDEVTQRPWMSLEYLGENNLYRFLRTKTRIYDYEKIVDLGIQLTGIVDYLHNSVGVYQLDIKPGNLAFDENLWNVKMMDLGSAFRSGFDEMERLGTPGYIAPEVFHDSNFTNASDIFSIGMVLFQCAFGKNPLIKLQANTLKESSKQSDAYKTSAIPISEPIDGENDSRYKELLTKMSEFNYSSNLESLEYPPEFSALVSKMCSVLPENRPTALEARNSFLEFKKKTPLPTIFISHSHLDKVPFVKKFVALLEKKNVPFWLDEKDVKVGEPFWERIGDAIETSDFVVVILSKNSIKSLGVAEELRTAQLYNLKKVKILPIRIDSLSFEKMPIQLRSRHILDFVGWEEQGVLEKKTDKFIADVISLFGQDN